MFCGKRQCRYSILAMFIQCFCIVHLQCHFGEPLCLFFFFLNSSYSSKRRYSYGSYIYFFFKSSVCTFFSFYIYCYTDIINLTIFSQLLRCQFHYRFSVLALFIYSAILVSHFVFFLFFLNSSYSSKRRYSDSSYIFFFFGSFVCTFFLLYILLY